MTLIDELMIRKQCNYVSQAEQNSPVTKTLWNESLLILFHQKYLINKSNVLLCLNKLNERWLNTPRKKTNFRNRRVNTATIICKTVVVFHRPGFVHLYGDNAGEADNKKLLLMATFTGNFSVKRSRYQFSSPPEPNCIISKALVWWHTSFGSKSCLKGKVQCVVKDLVRPVPTYAAILT